MWVVEFLFFSTHTTTHTQHHSTYNQPAIILEVGTLGHILLTVLTSRECGWEEVEGDRDKGGDVGKAIEVVAPL